MTTAVKIEKELNNYIHQLSTDQKKSLLGFIKTMFKSRGEEVESITIEQYNRELDEASAAMDRGEFYTNEEVFSLSNKLIDARKKG